jgi:hypothetical protein
MRIAPDTIHPRERCIRSARLLKKMSHSFAHA